MIEEEMLLHAIGELPEDLVTEENMDAIRAGADQIEREERKRRTAGFRKCVGAAACAAILVISIGVYYNMSGRGTDSGSTSGNADNSSQADLMPSGTESGKLSKDSDNRDSNAKSPVYVFAADSKENAACTVDNDAADNEDSAPSVENKAYDSSRESDLNEMYTMKRRIPSSRTVEIEPGEQGYIVFSLDVDFQLAVAAGKSKTYIVGENKKKHYMKEEKTSCRAGSRVYLDISQSKSALDVDVPEWDGQGKQVIAYAETELTGGGTFYICRSSDGSEKNNQKGVKYYGIFMQEG